jgi:N-dimethylarginine dimethylaminohydrolase
MSHANHDKININVATETDVLKTVMMRLAAPINLLQSFGDFFEPSILRQMLHNRFVPYNLERVQAQQLAFKDTLEAHGTRVILEAPIPGTGGHYPRDIGFSIDDTFFVARVATRARLPEVAALEPILPRFSKVMRLDAGHIEGGDVMLAPGVVMVGLGEASNMDGVESLNSALTRMGNKRKVMPMAFTHSGVIHLDTKFNIVAPNLGVISRESFQEQSLKWLEQHFELVDATPEETRAIHINTFVIGNGYVVMDARAERLASILQRKGLKPILLDYSEVTSVPGSFRCCTCPLERSADAN